MEYRVTALCNVTLRAFVRSQVSERRGNAVFMRPTEREEWVSLRAGEVREGLGLVVGVHPRDVPGEMPMTSGGVSLIYVTGWSDADLPREFFGLFRLEAQGRPTADSGVRAGH